MPIKFMALKPNRPANWKARSMQKGFSMIEIVIVVIIITILAAISIPSISTYLQRGKVTKATSDASQLSMAMNTYNLTLKTPLTSVPTTTTAINNLKTGLTGQGILPDLSIDISKVLKNISYDSATKRFKVKASVDTSGY